MNTVMSQLNSLAPAAGYNEGYEKNSFLKNMGVIIVTSVLLVVAFILLASLFVLSKKFPL